MGTGIAVIEIRGLVSRVITTGRMNQMEMTGALDWLCSRMKLSTER